MAGKTSPNFVKILGLADPSLARLQDNVAATLGPVAAALINTPVMGAKPPPWINLELATGWSLFASTAVAYAVPAVHRDALGYVHLKGFVQNSSGGALATAPIRLPIGYRPGQETRFVCEGTGLATNILSVTPDGFVTPQTAVINNGTLSLVLTFLAEQ